MTSVNVNIAIIPREAKLPWEKFGTFVVRYVRVKPSVRRLSILAKIMASRKIGSITHISYPT
ncbi:MAG: hypothetical protein NZ941_04150 [Candidatus Caldarchaeum sp.]|nr:hypothetical protein [Candidatus Caldarchaeum sp.]